MELKSALKRVMEKTNFQIFWFIVITIQGLLFSQLLDKLMSKANGIQVGLGDKISLAEVMIAITIVLICIGSMITIAVIYSNCMARVVEAHENCKKRAQSAHLDCENHIQKVKTTVLYKEELSSNNGVASDDFKKMKEPGYNILAGYIEKAENRILQVTSTPLDNLEEADYPSRKEYFSTLARKIESKKNTLNFKFIRIHQVQKIDDELPALDALTKDFYEKIINISNQSVGLLKVEQHRSYGFTIIDNKYLVIQMSGLKNSKFPVESGVFIFDDYDGSTLIKDFERYFDATYVKHQTKPIELSELKLKA